MLKRLSSPKWLAALFVNRPLSLARQDPITSSRLDAMLNAIELAFDTPFAFRKGFNRSIITISPHLDNVPTDYYPLCFSLLAVSITCFRNVFLRSTGFRPYKLRLDV